MATALKRPAVWIFLVALAARVVVILAARFDGLYGQDAYAYFDYARLMVSTPVGQALPGPIYWPLGYPALAALFFRLAGLGALGAQLASLLAGAAIAPVVYVLVLQLTTASPLEAAALRWGAVAAGLITALSGQLLQSSIVVMADAAGLLWATLAALWLLRFDRQRQPLWVLPAAASLALAIVTRWIFAGLALPFGLYGLLALLAALRDERFERPGTDASRASVPVTSADRVRAQPDSNGQAVQTPIPTASGQAPNPHPRHPRYPRTKLFSVWAGLAAGALFLLILLPQVAFSQASAAPVLSHGWVVGWNPANALRTSFDNPDGHFDYRWPPLVYAAEPLFHPLYLLPLFTPFVLLGAWQLRRSRLLVLLGGWPLVLYLYLVGVPYENFRFGLAFFPPLAALSGVGLAWAYAGLTQWQAGNPGLSSRAASLAFGVALLMSLPLVYRGLASFLAIKSGELAAARYLQSQVPQRASVFTFGLTLTLQHYTGLQVQDLYGLPMGDLRAQACASAPAFVYVEPDNLETQWAGQSPDVNYRWLRDRVGLVAVGRESTWVLSQVKASGCAAAQ
jgi:hypothetical protein